MLRPIERLHLWQVQMVRDLMFIAAIIGVFWLGYALRAVTVPLLIALLLAYLFEPLVAWMMQRWKLTRAQSAGAIVGGFVVLVVILVAFLTPIVVGQSVRLVNDIRSGDAGAAAVRASRYVPVEFRATVLDSLAWLPGVEQAAEKMQIEFEAVDEPDDPLLEGSDADDDSEPAPEDVPREAASGGEIDVLTELEIRAIVRDELAIAADDGEIDAEDVDDPDWMRIARGGVTAILEILGLLVTVSLLAFLIPFYFFFFSLWYHDVLAFGRSVLPEKNKGRTLELAQKMDRVVSGFVRGRIVIAFIMGALLAIGWAICGVPYAIVLGFVIGILCIVPYLGGVGIPLAAGLLLFSGLGEPHDSNWWWVWALFLPTLVFIIVQLIEGYLLTPMIAGKATNLDPVTIVVAVLAGGALLGVYGMLLAIPIAACLKIVFTDVLLPKIREWAAGRARDPLPID